MCCYLMMINSLPRLGSRMLWSDPTTPSRSFLMRGAPRDGRSKSTWHIVVVMRPHLAVVVTRRLDWSPWRARRRAVVRPCGSWACRDRAPASNGRTCPPASGQPPNAGTYAASRATAACVRGVTVFGRAGPSIRGGRAAPPEFGGWPGLAAGKLASKLWGRCEQVASG
jgi:hypothetical protein